MASILIVEDDEPIRKMLQLRLQLRGHEVEQAANGKEGVEKALQGSYDLVLMDMHMPVMDGHEAALQLKKQGYNKPVIAVTASAMSEDAEAAIKAGCNDHICKPIGPDFEEKIETFLAAGAGLE